MTRLRMALITTTVVSAMGTIMMVLGLGGAVYKMIVSGYE